MDKTVHGISEKKLKITSKKGKHSSIGIVLITLIIILFQSIYIQSINELEHLEVWNMSIRMLLMRKSIFMIIASGVLLIIVFYIAVLRRIKSNTHERIQNKYDVILGEQKVKFANFIEDANAATWEWNIETGEAEFNERWAEIIGYSLEELSPISIETWLKYANSEDLKASEAQLQKVFSGEKTYYEIECRMKHKEGHWVWIEDRGKVISWAEDGRPLIMCGTHIDVTEQKKNNDDFFKSTEKYKSIIEVSNTGVWEYDVKKAELWCSDAYFKMLGYEAKDFMGRDIKNLERLWTNFIHPDDVEDALKKFMLFISQESDDYYDNHFRMKRKDGGWSWIWSKGKVVRNLDEKNVEFVVGTHIDVTEMKRAQAKIEYLSYRDSLTGLYNRRYYENKLQEYSDEPTLPFCLVIIDVNGLKLVNDAFGHLVGDQLLVRVGEILIKKCRPQDIVSRIGGDEFIVLMPKLNKIEAENMVSRIIEAIDLEVIENMPISISCGSAERKEKQDRVELVFKRAEDDMYHNKVTERRSLRYQTVQIIMKTLYEKIPREEEHSQRVSEICVNIGEKLRMGKVDRKNLETAAMLHDIGKIGISNDILNKKGSLNEAEWLEIKKHPEISYNILSSVNEYGPLAEIVLCHHERWDGKGYPNKLRGEDIPQKARIISIADAYDAMVSDRPYRKGMDKDKALKVIESEAGKQFDPSIVEIFLELW